MRASGKAALVGVGITGLMLGARRLTGHSPKASQLSRNFRLAKLGARGGGRYASHRARKVFASAARSDELDTQFQLRTAEDVTRELGNMKGAMMKLGQMASYIHTGLPETVTSTLASLQHDAPPMSPELAAQAITQQLGAHPDQIFAEWDPVPIASASIGQVHRAMTTDNRAVAVKVQYPGVADAVRSDLANADWVFAALASVFPGVEKGPIVDEIRDRLVEELDYGLEAENQQYYADHFRGHPYIHVPDVLPELSSERVLTTELANGVRFDEVLTWPKAERDLVAETIFRFSFGSIYRLAAFNGDPHPGNYLFEKGGRVTFLDFGLVKRFEPEETAFFEQLLDHMVVNHDPARFRKLVEDGNLLATEAPFTTEQVIDYFAFFYRYVLEDKVTTLDADYASQGVAQLFDAGGEHGSLMKYLNVPPSFVVLQRITLGLMGLFAQLEPTANWQRIAKELWPFVNGAPSTPMGSADAAWAAERSHS